MDKLILCLATLGPIGKNCLPRAFGSLAGLLVFGGLMATQMGNDPMTLTLQLNSVSFTGFAFVFLVKRKILQKKTQEK